MKAKYKCPQEVLYSVLELAWDNYDFYLPRFSAYKASYNAATSVAGRALIAAAELLPGEQARGEASETLRIQLLPLGEKCALNFLKLKGYIRSAYDEKVWKPKFEAAGQGYYRRATRLDWESVNALNRAMMNFISVNGAVLAIDLQTLLPNMPAGFGTDVAGDATAFSDRYKLFKSKRRVGVMTMEKVRLNNLAYDAVVEKVFADARVIFADEEEVRRLFVFERLRERVDPRGAGSRELEAGSRE